VERDILHPINYTRTMSTILFIAMHENPTAILANKLVELDMFKFVDMSNVRHNTLWVSRGRLGVGKNKFSATNTSTYY
jgi:hypothetical protein